MKAEPSKPRARTWAALALVGLTLLVTWRVTTLSGLPDIGDPFDVAAFTAFTVPDDRNAFVLYRQASARMGKEPEDNRIFTWATAPEARRSWLATNREALALWRLGTDRLEALYIPPGELNFATQLTLMNDLRTFACLASLEATRLEAEGDFAAALGYHLAIVRSAGHCGHRGLPIERWVGCGLSEIGCGGLSRWAANPGVDPSLLRRAIDGVAAADALMAPVSDVLRGEYVSFVHSLPDPKLLDIRLLGSAPPTMYTWPGAHAILEVLPRIIKREPERSRRVARLMFANWLAACDLPPDRRPPRAGPPKKRSGGIFLQGDLLPELFALGAGAPAEARAIRPEDLARWWGSTLYASRFTSSFDTLMNLTDREQATRARLQVTLGRELYKRDHGADPLKDEDLVGPYLKALPEGYAPSPDK